MDFLKKFTESSAPKAESVDKSGAPADQSQSDLLSSAKVVAGAARSTFQKEPAKYDNPEVAGAAADLLDAAQTYGKLDKTAGVGGYVEKAENYLREYETSNTTKPKTTAEPTTDEKTTKLPTEEPEAKPSSEDIPSQCEEKVEEKPTSDETKPSSVDVPSQVKKEVEQPIKEEQKPSTEDVPSESLKEEETKPTELVKPTTEKSSYGEEKEEVLSESAKPSAKEPETEPTLELPSGLGQYAKVAEGFLKKNTEGDSAEGDAGQYVKAAEGFLNKQSEGSADDQTSKAGDSDQGGVGGIAKLAGSFLK